MGVGKPGGDRKRRCEKRSMIEIKIYGTGGQGAVVAAKLLADAAAKSGFYVQAFSAYGAERRGGRVESYVRLSKELFSVHCKVYEPDYVVMMDEVFARDAANVSSIRKGGGLLINSANPPETFSSLGNIRLATVDANRIAAKNGVVLPNGMPVINTTVLGALLGMLTGVEITRLIEAIREGKIPAAEKNIMAAKEAYDVVVSGASGKVSATENGPDIVANRHPVYRDNKPPCEAGCPAGHAIHKTISLVREDRFEEALENIWWENPFPGMTGRVCFHPCEARCNANEFSQGVAINALERAVFDRADRSRVMRPAKKENTGKRVAVIGSGPAGMTCAYYLNMMGQNVTVFEASPLVGGIPRAGIPAYRLPKEVVDREMGEVIALGVEVQTNTRVGKDISFDSILERYDTCFLAVGAHRSVKMNIPGEDGEGVISGLDFLKRVAFGERVALGSKVAVIGGGNTAIDAARTARRLGAQEVTILYRRTIEEMPAYPEEVEAAQKEGVKIEYLTVPTIIHHEGRRLSKLECVRTRLGQADADGRCRPVVIEGSNFMSEVDNVIAATGETLEISFLPDTIEMNGPLIKVDGLGRTSVPGVYAGGDATNPIWTVSEAIGSGKRAAIGIDMYLRGEDGKGIITAGKGLESGAVSMERYLKGEHPLDEREVVSFSDLNVRYFQKAPRAKILESSDLKGTQGFSEVRLSLFRKEAVAEAGRCFHCGHCNSCGNCFVFCPDAAIAFAESSPFFRIDSSLCKGCGICINECPRDAIAWGGGPR